MLSMITIITIDGSFVSVDVVAVVVVVVVPVFSATDAALLPVRHCLDLEFLTIAMAATTTTVPSYRFIPLR